MFWWPREAPLKRNELTSQANPPLPSCALEFRVQWRLQAFAPDFFIGTSGEERQSISRALRVLAEARLGEPLHCLLGESDPIQNPVELDLHERFEGESMDEEEENPAEYYERLFSQGLKWRLLFQLDSQRSDDGGWRWMWGRRGDDLLLHSRQRFGRVALR